MYADYLFEATHNPRPAPDQPGCLLDQMRCVVTAIRLGDSKGTSASKECKPRADWFYLMPSSSEVSDERSTAA